MASNKVKYCVILCNIYSTGSSKSVDPAPMFFPGIWGQSADSSFKCIHLQITLYYPNLVGGKATHTIQSQRFGLSRGVLSNYIKGAHSDPTKGAPTTPWPKLPPNSTLRSNPNPETWRSEYSAKCKSSKSCTIHWKTTNTMSHTHTHTLEY